MRGFVAAGMVVGGGFLFSATALATPTAAPGSDGQAAGGAFAPYVDTSLSPAFDLVATAKDTGVDTFNLAFLTSGGGCDPKWGGWGSLPRPQGSGGGDLNSNEVAGQIDDLRAAGGDVRVSFGGASGSELALACSSADELAGAYGKAIDAFKLTKVDFDIEGSALPNTEANTRRAQAIAQLQKDHPDLDVSFTLPVMPEGLTQPGTDLLKNAKDNGVNVSAVNIMAMDYGPSYSDDMAKYAEQAATAAQGQIKDALGVSDSEAWQKVAITPMIGVNDVNTEKFTVDNATELVKFAQEKGAGWLSMWSATRDKPCDGGSSGSAQPTCSSIDQDALAFTKAFGAYK
ncbi:hypothetical protein Sm713_29340 [Streptomyces sp. TS71-3]|nr:hypothetical protein Sm713_29340 [Streptomyces sp. TS71-3]